MKRSLFLLLIVSACHMVLAVPVSAQDTASTGTTPPAGQETSALVKPNIVVTIGDFSGNDFSDVGGCSVGSNCPMSWIGEYVAAIYSYGIMIAAILATVVIMAAGFLWLTSAGNPTRVSTAKELISGALSGLGIALFSYILLYAVNPELIPGQGGSGRTSVELINPSDLGTPVKGCCYIPVISGCISYKSEEVCRQAADGDAYQYSPDLYCIGDTCQAQPPQ